MNGTEQRDMALREALAVDPDWQILLRHFDFNDGFAIVLLLMESAENAVFCREALSDYLLEHGRGSLRLIACRTPEKAQDLPYLLHRPAGLDKAQTLWIESVIPEGSVSAEELEQWKSAWRVGFAGLNRIRNTMQRTIPCALVFAVAPWMQELIRSTAPDFWSIRSTVVRPHLRISGEEMERSALRPFERPETDPDLAPDPEFALQEAEAFRGKPGKEGELARILQRAGQGFLARSEPVRAIAVLEESRVLFERADTDPSGLSATISFLGRAYKADAQWAKAESSFIAALEVDQQRLGAESATVASDLMDLGQLLIATNRFSEAEPIIRRALAIDERVYGSDHPNAAIDLNELGRLLQETGRHTEAESFLRRALTITESKFAPDHPWVAIQLSNLASLLQDTGRLSEAEPLMRRALAILERSYGPDHPKTAPFLNNLATLLQDTNRLAEAEPLIRRALAIDERSYGSSHPNIATRLNNLALLLRAAGRAGEAEPILRRAVRILEDQKRTSGYEPPRLAAARENYAQLLPELGWSAERMEEILQADPALDTQQPL